MTTPPTFQSLILTLQHFWADRGCLIWQPYYAQVGAGTMNPATFLRVLGPEPWNVAYVEPSIRPDDGRYGENPNRLQQHYQFQVVLKPDPGNPQEIYLQSLEAVGINPRQHDIRFVEDNWEAPALGAWGLGWEVWLDGQEITQFTYFQQAGGQILEPVSVEITYGLERILFALQRVYGFRDLRWNDTITYGEVNLQGEQEHSRYYFDVADIDRMRQMFDLFEAEARAALDAGLVLPAHDYVLKCSHTFNVLDTRGAVGVTERAAFFGRMRELSRRVAQAYLEQRERLEFPMLKEEDGSTGQQGNGSTGQWVSGSMGQRVDATISPLTSQAIDPLPFLLEIGTEELPASDLDAALAQLGQLFPAMLSDLRLEHGPVTISGTPRRLAVYVDSLAPAQAELGVVHRGPPAARAYDRDGRPTQAAEGFARSKGVRVDALETRTMEGGEYVVAILRGKGRPAAEVLAEKLPGLLAAIKFDKTMRWNASGVSFSRPVRWLVALHGAQVIPFEYAGLVAGRTSRGPRPQGTPEVVIPDAQSYAGALETAGIVLDVAARRERIRAQAGRLAAEVGGVIPENSGLLAEVANLVETPTCFQGGFERSYLELPQAVLVSVMQKHQRYFPLMKNGRLLSYFIGVRNGDGENLELVLEGNEHVLHARFADAAFFIRQDLEQPLAAYRAKLATLTFQEKLGSLLEKSERIESLTAELAPLLALDEAETRTARRAAQLCKADLATRMVIEMTSLQGVIGRVYALRSGEPEAVARAIFEHYFPEGVTPDRPGLCVGLADRLDSLVGLFALGLGPTGAKDPFALRRAALSLVQALLAAGVRLDLRAGLQAAANIQPVKAGEPVLAECLGYLKGRLRGVLIDSGYRFDVVEAVLAESGHDPVLARQAVEELSAWVVRPDWPQILAAYARCVRITRDQSQTFKLDPAMLAEPSERALFESYQTVAGALQGTKSVDRFLAAFAPIVTTISTFFEDILVMTDDPSVRANRLALLQRIAALTRGLVDLSKLEGF